MSAANIPAPITVPACKLMQAARRLREGGITDAFAKKLAWKLELIASIVDADAADKRRAEKTLDYIHDNAREDAEMAEAELAQRQAALLAADNVLRPKFGGVS